jgi:hypothetical protein
VSDQSTKIFLILFICSGLLSLFASAYMRFSEGKGSSDPGRVRTLSRKFLWRGVSTEVLSLIAYALLISGRLTPWLILIVLVALVLGIEFLIARTLNLSGTVNGQ